MMSCVAVLMMRTMRLSVPMRDTPAMQSRNVLYCWKWIFTRRPILKGEKNSNAYRGLVREDGYGDCFNLEHQVTRDCIENVNFYKNHSRPKPRTVIHSRRQSQLLVIRSKYPAKYSLLDC